ncbi:DUF2189 domain-containing protein [Muricoccus radiodurans]|uniref:DUF2189 domain-containing protein n=1 Tax=Muricoccus radiodurans TaxID=2231721 RepID=UPI003CF1D47C
MAEARILTRAPDDAALHDEPLIRRIGAAEVWDALREGWEDFQAHPTQLVFLGILYPVLGFVIGYAASGRNALPLLWPLVSGFALLGPVAAIGIYELSRRRERNLPSTWLNAFDVLRSPNLGGVLLLGLGLLVLFVLWLLVARGIYDAIFTGPAPASFEALVRAVLHTPEGHRLMLVGNAVGFLFALVVLMVSVVSFPLMLDRPVGPLTAVRTSVRAVLANPAPLALWGLIVAGLLAIGSVPVLVGLAVVVPVLGHATWHLYRKLVAR